MFAAHCCCSRQRQGTRSIRLCDIRKHYITLLFAAMSRVTAAVIVRLVLSPALRIPAALVAVWLFSCAPEGMAAPQPSRLQQVHGGAGRSSYSGEPCATPGTYLACTCTDGVMSGLRACLADPASPSGGTLMPSCEACRPPMS